jgi:hypothetical protein
MGGIYSSLTKPKIITKKELYDTANLIETSKMSIQVINNIDDNLELKQLEDRLYENYIVPQILDASKKGYYEAYIDRIILNNVNELKLLEMLNVYRNAIKNCIEVDFILKISDTLSNIKIYNIYASWDIKN